jgi:hypothetical protein
MNLTQVIITRASGEQVFIPVNQLDVTKFEFSHVKGGTRVYKLMKEKKEAPKLRLICNNGKAV